MRIKKGKFGSVLILVFCLIFSACGGRLPSPQTAQKIIAKQFHKYGRKYRESDFGKHKVTRVEISEVQEIQKDLAEVEAYTFLEDGPVYRVRFTLAKKPFGWKYASWESLGVR